VITIPEIAAKLKKRLYSRLRQSLDYFYPMRDREHDTGLLKSMYTHRLLIKFGVVHNREGSFKDINLLKDALQAQIGNS
jgi:hypothetical protein